MRKLNRRNFRAIPAGGQEAVVGPKVVIISAVGLLYDVNHDRNACHRLIREYPFVVSQARKRRTPIASRPAAYVPTSTGTIHLPTRSRSLAVAA